MLVVVGGGCFGSYHARQLLKAVRAGCLPDERLLVVDRNPGCRAGAEFAGAREVTVVTADWLAFLREWLPSARPSDRLIPAPLAPHLLWEWLAEELSAARLLPPRNWALPYERPGPGGELYVSAAAWTCPATCVEPVHCPALHAPRDWDLAEIIEGRARALGYEPAVLRCVHLAYGVGAIAAGEVLAARERGRSATRLLVATSSRCHAALGALEPARTG